MLTRSYKKLLLFFLSCLILSYGCIGCANQAASPSPSGISIVATENFYGDLAHQIAGNRITVTSILADPNIDPHQYEPSISNKIQVNAAQIVIENGDGYDTWMDKLLAAAPDSNRIVLVGSQLAQTRLPDNPHVWYDIHNMEKVAQSIDAALKKLDSADATTFDRNLNQVLQSLNRVIQKIDEIKGQYANAPVGLTEDIYLYQANLLQLHVLTPFAFQKAIAEGNDPPADTIATTINQLRQHQVKVLIYNNQTVTPITTNIQNIAQQQHIPIVPVTETMPQGKTYQQWMLDQLTTLEQALRSA